MALRSFEGEWLRIGRFPADEKFNQWLLNGSVAAWNLPFGRSVQTAVGGGLAWIAITDRYEIRGYDRDGRLLRLLRIDRTPRPVTDELRSRYFAYHIESAEDEEQRRLRRSLHDIVEFPLTLPELDALHLDAEGRLWVREYALPWESGPRRWRVFDSDGVAEATVDLPAGLEVQEIGQDYVRGLWRDELGVEYIRTYAILR